MKQNKNASDNGEKRHTHNNKVPSSSLLPSQKTGRSSGIPISIPMNDPRSGRIVRSDQVRMNQTSNLTNVRQESRVARMKNKEHSSRMMPGSFPSGSKAGPQSGDRKRTSREISSSSGNNRSSSSSSSSGNNNSNSNRAAHKVFDLTDTEDTIDSTLKRQKTRISHGRRLSVEDPARNIGVVLEDSDEEVKLVRGTINHTSGRRGFCITSSQDKRKNKQRATPASSTSFIHKNDNIIDKATAVISKTFPSTSTQKNDGLSSRPNTLTKSTFGPFDLCKDDGDDDQLMLLKKPGTSVRVQKTKTTTTTTAAAAFKEIDAFTDAILAEKSKTPTTNVPQRQARKATTMSSSSASSQRPNMSLSKQKTQRPINGALFDEVSGSPSFSISTAKNKSSRSGPVPIAVPTRSSARLSSRIEREPICIDLDDEESSQVEKHNEPVCSYPSTGAGSIRIFKSDVERLERNEFLNDTLIEFYLRWLLDHSRNGHEIYVFNSFFYERLSNSTSDDPYDTVRRWAAKADIFKKRFIFIPVNENFHWFLIVVTDPGSCIRETPGHESRIFILDSLGIKRTRVGKTIQKYLKSAAQDRCNIVGSDFHLPRIYHANVPIQGNAFDCGVYLLHFAQTCMADPDRFQQLLLANHLDDSAWRASAVQGLRSTIARTIRDIESQ